MTVDQMFAIEGVLAELDNPSGTDSTLVYLGGMEGVKVTEEGGSVTNKSRAIFTGSDLRSDQPSATWHSSSPRAIT